MTRGDGEPSFVLFRVGGCDLALEVKAVEEVIRLGKFTDLGRRIPGVDGAIPLHGQVVPVVYLNRLLRIDSEDPPMAVVATGRGHQVALGVDEVMGVYEKPTVEDEGPLLPALEGRGVREIHRVGRRIVCWLDLDGVFSEEGWEAIRSLSEMETDGLLGDTTLGILGY
jgi:chemotaxis signal transduction protein